MEGVAQNNLRVHVVQAAGHHTLNGSVGTDGHKDGRLNHAVVEGQAATTGKGAEVGATGRVGFQSFKCQHGGCGKCRSKNF